MTTVVDASFAVNWLLAGDGSELDQLLIEAQRGGLLAPVIFWHEATSALRNLGPRSVLTRAERDDALRRLVKVGVSVDEQPPEIGRVLQMSDQFNLTIYNASYLELASRTGSDLASNDAALKQSAARIGLRVIDVKP